MATRPDHPLDTARNNRRLVIRVVRMAFFVLITTVALVTFIQRVTDQGADLPGLAGPTARLPGASGSPSTTPDRPTSGSAITPRTAPSLQPQRGEVIEVAWWVPVAIALGLFGMVVLIDVATPNKKISSISAVLFGLLAGILATVAISAIIELALRVWLPERALAFIEPLIQIIKPLLGIALCYLGITTILQTQDDFRLVIPYVEFAKQIRGTKPLVLDTSALIDARIADVASTGMLQAPLIIPRFVVGELQALADSNDKLKRARGRRGLDVVTRLQRQGTLDLSIDETPVAAMAVDQALVQLAEQLTARIVTTDHGLTRVAQIHGVAVLNMHEIAAAFRPALIPGETLALRLIKVGEQAGQGVGYLDDGTMVVAENAAPMIGREVQVMVTSTIQTTAGRMVFARLSENGVHAPMADDDRTAEQAVVHGVMESPDDESRPEPPPVPPEAGLVNIQRTDLDDELRMRDEHGRVVADAGDVTEGHAATRAVAPPAAGGASSAGGPFPPKPPVRRPPSSRNPRR